MLHWGVEEVAQWVEQSLLMPYGEHFRRGRIDGTALLELDEVKLENFSVTDTTHIIRLLSHIAVFRVQIGRSPLPLEIALPAEWASDAKGDDPGAAHPVNLLPPPIVAASYASATTSQRRQPAPEPGPQTAQLWRPGGVPTLRGPQTSLGRVTATPRQSSNQQQSVRSSRPSGGITGSKNIAREAAQRLLPGGGGSATLNSARSFAWNEPVIQDVSPKDAAAAPLQSPLQQQSQTSSRLSSGLPSSQTSSRPPSRPTSRPSSRPTSRPSSQPSSRPSSRPRSSRSSCAEVADEPAEQARPQRSVAAFGQTAPQTQVARSRYRAASLERLLRQVQHGAIVQQGSAGPAAAADAIACGWSESASSTPHGRRLVSPRCNGWGAWSTGSHSRSQSPRATPGAGAASRGGSASGGGSIEESAAGGASTAMSTMSADAETTYSSFGVNRHRGLSFSTTKRLAEPPPTSPGPARYGPTPSSFTANTGTFNRETRTLDGATRGKSSPGVGSYSPPTTLRKSCAFTTAARTSATWLWKPAESAPGPMSYSPRHHVLSTFK